MLSDEPVQVVVTPSQAAYFAGERLSVTITITNTRVPQANVRPQAAPEPKSSHRRGAHSVSYFPMSRPPTSPGTQSLLPAPPNKSSINGTVVARRGIVGKTRPPKAADEGNGLSAAGRHRALLTRSHSMSLSPDEFRADTLDDMRVTSAPRRLQISDTSASSPSSPRTVTTLTRDTTVPIHHPHARKQSVSEIQPYSHFAVPPSPSSFMTPNTSTFSLKLDPIAEGATSPMPPETPAANSPITNGIFDTPTSIASHSGPTRIDEAATAIRQSEVPPLRSPATLGFGPPPAVTQPPKSRIVSSSEEIPEYELILYTYAQLSGSVTITPLRDVPQAPEQIVALQGLRRALVKSKAIGGGSMEIASHNQHPLTSNPNLRSSSTRRTAHARAASLSGGLLAMLSPSSLSPVAPSTSSRPARHSRSPSMFGSFFYSGSIPSVQSSASGHSLNPQDDDGVDGDIPLPTFEVQPSMLAVDLKLRPGESRSSDTYELDLPRNLPPSYRGRTLKLSYEFVIGICRSSNMSSGTSSRVMKVPVRIYNNVSPGSTQTPYDLFSPSASQKTIPTVIEVRNPFKKYQSYNIPDSGPTQGNTTTSLGIYAHNLASQGNKDSSYEPPGVNSYQRYAEDTASGSSVSCRQAVEMHTRNPKKLSFDVNKDGTKVAVLTFTKSAYRLGETILGVVELNTRASRARVLKLSASLEAHESLPDSLAQPPPVSSRQLRRVHADYHCSLMTSTLRTSFSLDIPPDASPAFQIVVPTPTGLQSTGGLEWKIRLSLLVSIASPSAKEGIDGLRLKNLVAEGPRGEWGTTWTAARTVAPSERLSPTLANDDLSPSTPRPPQSWTTFFTSAFLGSTGAVERYHDGDEDIDSEREQDAEEEWKEVQVEMVECEVPIKVWPGNTAFKAPEVVFEV